jgi:hypothetical protein
VSTRATSQIDILAQDLALRRPAPTTTGEDDDLHQDRDKPASEVAPSAIPGRLPPRPRQSNLVTTSPTFDSFIFLWTLLPFRFPSIWSCFCNRGLVVPFVVCYPSGFYQHLMPYCRREWIINKQVHDELKRRSNCCFT